MDLLAQLLPSSVSFRLPSPVLLAPSFQTSTASLHRASVSLHLSFAVSLHSDAVISDPGAFQPVLSAVGTMTIS